MEKNDNKIYSWMKYYIGMNKTLQYDDISMYENVRRICEKYPKNIAYSYFGNKTNYKKMLNKIDELAYSYHKIGVKKKDIVTICMPNTPEAILSIYALNKLGAVVNMIHPLSSEEEIKYALKLTHSKYILIIDMAFNKLLNIKNEVKLEKIIWVSIADSMDTSKKLIYFFTKGIKILTPYGDNVISYTDLISFNKFGKNKIIDEGKKDDEAVILYSGGTTGKQKGIMLTNNNLNSLVKSGTEINKELVSGRTILGAMPIFHGFGLAVTFHSALSCGAHVIILPIIDPKKVDETILKYKPNIIACVPGMLESLPTSKKLKNKDLSFLKCLAIGGDTASKELEIKINKFLKEHNSNTRLRSAYGLTEATACATMMPKETSKLTSVGVPIPDVIIKICKVGTTEEVNTNTDGEICISGPTIMKGYYKEKEETEKVLKKHKDGKVYLHTGDMGYIDEDGFVYFKSRIKRLIVSSGYNIYPSQIEEVILKSPYVKACVVVGKPHPYKKEVAKAYIVLKDGIELTSEIKKSIKTLVKKNISAYAIPYSYGYRKELPKTKIGKIAYKEINDKDNIEEDDSRD